MSETITNFEQRKSDHIRLSLDPKTEATGLTGLDQVHLAHDALPDLNFDEVSIEIEQLGAKQPTPFLISSMTAGHENALQINERLMTAAQLNGWAMGVGSQRRELFDKEAHKEWLSIRKKHPKLRLYGNIGIAQCIEFPLSAIQRLVDNLEADALQIHLNPLQECIQPEGTPNFKGALSAIEAICNNFSVPIIIKETGCGVSVSTMKKLNEVGISALDVSGFGGTHWGRIEGFRAESFIRQQAAKTFANWGVSTLNSLNAARAIDLNYELWGSGGIRNGLDAAKLLAFGAKSVGLARPMLQAALEATEEVSKVMNLIEFELKTALFCSGHGSIQALQENDYALL